MASSSSSYASDSQNCSRWKYHVFLSFRGEDTRKIFTSHLYEGLKNRGIFTFQDDKRLEKGDSIPEELLKAIEESQFALVIFSKNYATSRWCLDELVKIMECKEVKKQIVIPVFYDVDPSDVRYQTGSFAEAFSKHKSRYKDDVDGMQMVQGWRTALSAAANLSGCNVHDRIESECIRELVDDLSSKLCKTSSSYLQYTVGIDTHLKEVKSLLEMEPDGVRILGIWGMGGVGKTTLARAVFDTLSPQFQYASFLEDVKETNINEMHSLQNKLLSELLREDKKYVNDRERGKSQMARRLRFMKVLVVLDDINHPDHLEYLAGDLDWFGSGSRIIATTRDKQIIGKNNVVYEVTTLPERYAIQLFNHYAFKDEAPDEHIKKLALEVVSLAKGLPLALRLWGSWLCNKDKTEWREAVDLIKRESSQDVVKKLKISFEALQDKEKTIFLDIACFFRGWIEKDIIKILESYDLDARIRLRGLIEKSLVFISKFNTIQMHDLIQNIGRDVVKMQKDSGKPSRVWNVEDFEDVMMDNMGTRAMEVIWLRTSKKLSFSKEAMKNMQRLRILSIEGYSNDGSIEYLPNNLCFFDWYGCPWKLLPENFNPRRLVHLDLRRSLLHYLWNETKLQQLPSLRSLNLSLSKSLKRTPDFKGMPNLEYLDLYGCTSLEEVHPSLKYCKKLIELDLSYCTKLKRFPYVNVESLESLNLGSCSSLEKFPEIHGRMKQGTAINNFEHLPQNISKLGALEYLDLSDCKRQLPEDIGCLSSLKKLYLKENNFDHLPQSISKLGALEYLDLSGCKRLTQLPEDIVCLSSLKELLLKGNNFEHLPQSISKLGALEYLDLSDCKRLTQLPEDIGCLSSLKLLLLKGNNFEHLPQSISKLGALEYLDLSDCKRLTQLPEDIGCLSSLKVLLLKGNNFEHLPQSISKLGALEYLKLSDCKRLTRLPEDIGCLSSLKDLNLRGNNFEHLPQSISKLGALNYLKLSECKRLTRLPEDIGCLSSLKGLNLRRNNFEHLPQSISELGALKDLDLSDCERLTQLPELPQQLHIIDAYWSNDWICNSLFQNISSLQHDICSSLRVFVSSEEDIPSWFKYQGMGTSVSVNLPKNWYEPDKFLGFAVCYSVGRIDCITTHLIPLCDDGMSSITQEFALSNNSDELGINFLLVPLGGLWDASNANEKTPNDYGYIKLDGFRKEKNFGVRLLYKDESELCIGIRKSRYEEEATYSSSKKQRQLSPTSSGL